MSQKLNSIKSGQDTVRYLDSSHYESRRQVGSHVTYTSKLGRITACDDPRELPPWLRKKIIKTIIAIGLALAMLVYVLPMVQL